MCRICETIQSIFCQKCYRLTRQVFHITDTVSAGHIPFFNKTISVYIFLAIMVWRVGIIPQRVHISFRYILKARSGSFVKIACLRDGIKFLVMPAHWNIDTWAVPPIKHHMRNNTITHVRQSFELIARLWSRKAVHLWKYHCASIRATESESSLELGSVRVDPFCLESDKELESMKLCRLLFMPESQNTARQQMMILAERLCIVPKTWNIFRKGK